MREKKFTLHNGLRIPAIGFGTWLLSDGRAVRDAVVEAIDAGYRLIDTATLYGNERGIGKAIGEAGLDRKDVFVTTKLPADVKGYDETIKAFEHSLERLDTNYVDLYLIHSPKPWGVVSDGMEYMAANVASWRAMEDLYRERRIRAIGVSNFGVKHLEALLEEAEITPMVNQIEIHPGHVPKDVIAFSRQRGIIIEAYSPFAQGAIFAEERLRKLAEKYERTIAQIVLRWHYQQGFIPLPKSKTPERICENIAIFDFKLTAADMEKIG